MSEWKAIIAVSEMEGLTQKFIEVDEDLQVMLFRGEDENLYCVEAWCSHQKVSLAMGQLDGYEVMCTLHGARFDIRDGKHLCMPAIRPLQHFPLREEAEQIEIDISDA